MSLYSNNYGTSGEIFGISKKQLISYSFQVLAIFAGTFLILFVLGLVPESLRPAPSVDYSDVPNSTISTSNQPVNTNPSVINNNSGASVSSPKTTTLPTRVVIGKIGVDATIQHPQSQNVAVLDQALTRGAVYYPGSGTIEQGNMFLFGHSTNWQIVQNQAYKTFNGLEKLSAGDTITVWGSDGKTYKYTVQKVSLLDDSAALVNFDTTGRKLTISTCNTFGQKQERWVVEAVISG